MMQQFLKLLQHKEFDLDAEAIADILWLASQLGPGESPKSVSSESAPLVVIEHRQGEGDRPPPTPPPANLPERQPQVSVSSPPPQPRAESSTTSGLSFQAPAAPALRNALELGRSLRPLMRKVPSRTEQVLDEEATAIRIAESAGQRQWLPVFQPAPERWLDLALVVEASRSTVIWQSLISEFQALLERQGAFRNIRTWSLQSDASGTLELFAKHTSTSDQQHPRSPKALLDPSGRQLVLLLSDCVSPAWRQGQLHRLLKQWSSVGPTAIVQFLPERLWTRSALGLGLPVQLSAFVPGVANPQLEVADLPVWETVDLSTALTLPIVTLEADSLGQWARVVGGLGNAQTAGMVFDLALVAAQSQTVSLSEPIQPTPEELVQRFRTTASPMARRLAGLMSVVPVSLPVVHLIQEAVLPASRQVHVAEVFMSGLLAAQATHALSEPARYEFVAGVRELLQPSVPKTDALTVLDKISQYIAERAGLSIRSFAALLMLNSERGNAVGAEVQRFAEITTEVLRRLGGEYAALAEEIEGSVVAEPATASPLTTEPFPPLQTFEFEVATISIDPARDDLQPFEFDMVTIEVQRTGISRGRTKLVQTRSRQQGYCSIEDLGNEVQLEMVAISGGSFLMGAPKGEDKSSDAERPQHQVNVPAFFMGKYPITQAQWRVVAALPQINRELNPDLSRFKGKERPVERVSWREAVEFCERLSHQTGKEYRLPSEAEWEYACRAGTTTPFHFGETITTDLANYNGNSIYGAGPKGTYRVETTPASSFGVANAFGLYDMHGNVWEWCLDHWHGNYEGAPTDGSAWVAEGDSDSRVLRGGSWMNHPANCRSAYRYRLRPDNTLIGYSFRVVCSASRTR